MLKKVCCAIGSVCLRPTAGVDPYTNSRGLCPRRVFSCYLRFDSVQDISNISGQHTVKPLDKVVLSVRDPWLTGVAKPLFTGWIDFKAARLRRAWLRFKAKRCAAMPVEHGYTRNGYSAALSIPQAPGRKRSFG